jgi:LPS-assembly protein
MLVSAAVQEADGEWYRLRGAARIETTEIILAADEIDYNEKIGYAEARGKVSFLNIQGGEELYADRVEYSLAEETGKFYGVRGSAKGKIDARPGILTTTSPFSFQGEWAERIRDRYILHNGFVTNCKLPNPWWTLRGPKFDIIPNERAIAHDAVFRVRSVPLFYTPMFYKSLERQPRKSGFLTPNMGNSSRRGTMIGGGYYWAPSRSYDFTYRTQLFTQRGFAHHVDVRGKPRHGTDFNAILYGVNDRGAPLPDGGRGPSQGGYIVTFDGQSDLGKGFSARGSVNYLSSLVFRQTFTESFSEAIFSEVQSIGFVTKHWDAYGLNLVFSRNENFQTADPGDKIVIRRLPQLEFVVRDKPIAKELPFWFSLESAAGLVRRNQPLFQTRQYVQRADFEPRIMTALRWKDFHIVPAFSIRETHYGASQEQNLLTGGIRIAGSNLLRSSREFSVDFVPPTLERTFDAPKWLGGDKLKHVIEPRAAFRDVSGIDNFDDIIRFDETDILSNTREAEFSITNRFYVKRNNEVSEVLSWQVWQRRYFDPDFGGAVITGRRNVVLSQTQLTAYAFLDRPRHYSPVISLLRVNPKPIWGLEWRSDFDPLRNKVTNSGFTSDARFSKYFFSLGHNQVRSVPLLSPSANQFRALVGIGNDNKRGWNAAVSTVYDFRLSAMQFATTQITYNTDCCGFSLQYRRFNFGPRQENQFRMAFVIANIGSFGTLKRQERLF